jgi:hypothetical protein
MKQVKLTLYKKNGKKVYYPFSSKIRRLRSRADLGNYEKMHIYVSYGKQLDINNKMSVFYNDAYVSPKEARTMLDYFWEG